MVWSWRLGWIQEKFCLIFLQDIRIKKDMDELNKKLKKHNYENKNDKSICQ